MDDRSSEHQISRRTVLKRIGAGTAIGWSLPVITSLSTPALAQASPPPVVCSSCGCLGEILPFCRQEPPLSCNCVLSVAGVCECLDISDVGNACGPGDTCPSGYVCVRACDASTLCVAQCP